MSRDRGALERQNALLIAALAAVEWLPMNLEDFLAHHHRLPGENSDGQICPWCGGVQINGHNPGCARQAALEPGSVTE